VGGTSLSVSSVMSKLAFDEEIVHTKCVCELPPSDGCSSRVSFESRNGMCPRYLRHRCPGADEARSRCRCGRSRCRCGRARPQTWRGPVQMWTGPGADCNSSWGRRGPIVGPTWTRRADATRAASCWRRRIQRLETDALLVAEELDDAAEGRERRVNPARLLQSAAHWLAFGKRVPFFPKPLHQTRTFCRTPSVIVFFAFSDPARSTCGKSRCRCGQVLSRCGSVLCRCGQVLCRCGQVLCRCGQVLCRCGQVLRILCRCGSVLCSCGQVLCRCG
jgi:hypothetical protein